MHPRTVVAVAVGGAAGAALRYVIVEASDAATSWPWGVFIANVLGCAVLGFVVGAYRRWADTPLFLGATAGFCGALTTFSAFAVDIALFMRNDDWTRFGGYLLASVVAGLIVFTGGRTAGRTLANREQR